MRIKGRGSSVAEGTLLPKIEFLAGGRPPRQSKSAGLIVFHASSSEELFLVLFVVVCVVIFWVRFWLLKLFEGLAVLGALLILIFMQLALN